MIKTLRGTLVEKKSSMEHLTVSTEVDRRENWVLVDMGACWYGRSKGPGPPRF